jgi:hypothetical protein
MYFFTHLFLSKTLYKHFSEQIILDKRAFAYGNVKPDILRPNPPIPHTLENYLFMVNEQALDLMENESTIKEFSEKLGEVCHHLCDFFCYYHLNEEIYNKKLKHFIYELLLHYDFYRLRFSGKLKAVSSKKEPNQNIAAIVLKMRQDYFSEPSSYKKDIDYALNTAIWACESILFFMNYPTVLTYESHSEELALQRLEGGGL